MPVKSVYVRRRRNRADHLWIFSNEIQRCEGNPQTGDLVRVYETGRFIGCGIYNPKSLIAVRLYSRREEELDETLIKERIERAYQLRRSRLPGEEDFRLVYSESDWLPGLVIDKYRDHFAIQIYAAGFENRMEMVINALVGLFDVAAVFEKNDFKLREPEGLERREGLIYGTPRKGLIISENGVRFYVDIAGGQKTGYFFDHRLTRQKVRKLSKNRKVLDVFSYTGSFAINAALGGAVEVTGVDISPAAVAMAKSNARLNGVDDVCNFVVADAFDFMHELSRKGARFDLINLDPPSFIKSQKEKTSGVGGYIKINTLAFKLLKPGGILVSSSCSHYLFWQDLLDVLVKAAQDAGRTFTILDRSTQGPDHPILPQMPESEYLRCLIVQAV